MLSFVQAGGGGGGGGASVATAKAKAEEEARQAAAKAKAEEEARQAAAKAKAEEEARQAAAKAKAEEEALRKVAEASRAKAAAKALKVCALCLIFHPRFPLDRCLIKVDALAADLSSAKWLDDDDEAWASAAAELYDLGVKKVEDLAHAEESDVRDASAAAKLSKIQTNRLVKLWAQVSGGGQVRASLSPVWPYTCPDRMPAFPQAPAGSTSVIGGGGGAVSTHTHTHTHTHTNRAHTRGETRTKSRASLSIFIFVSERHFLCLAVTPYLSCTGPAAAAAAGGAAR